MKKALSIVVALSLVLGSGIPAYAAKAPAKTPVKAATVAKPSKIGVIKNVTLKSITVLESGKTNTYSISSKTKITSLGSPVDILEAGKKGLKANLIVNGKDAVSIDVLPGGTELEGVAGLSIVDVRANPDTESNIMPKDRLSYDDRSGLMNGTGITVSDEKNVDETTYLSGKGAAKGATKIEVGQIKIVPKSMKVTLKGKELKVLEDVNAKFDPTDATDEVKFAKGDADAVVLEFESPITDKDLSEEELLELVKISFKKTQYTLIQTEFTTLPFHEDVYAELNGKETTLAKALYRGNAFQVRANAAQDIVYVNGYYKDLLCKVNQDAKTKKLNITAFKYGSVAFTDIVELSPQAVFLTATGVPTSLTNVIKAPKVKLTVDPIDNCRVISIQVAQ